MMIPSVHLNGTGAKTLCAELVEAVRAVDLAIEALHRVTVHGRDYYVQGPHAYGQARTEMDARLQALGQVSEDLQTMYDALETHLP